MESWYNWYDWPGHGNNRGMHGPAWSANTWPSGERHSTAASASHDAWQATAASASSPNQWKSSEWHATVASSPSPDQWESSEWHGTAASAPNKGSSRKHRPAKWERLRNRGGLEYAMRHRKMAKERLTKARKKYDEAVKQRREGPALQAFIDEIDKQTTRLHYIDTYGIIWLDSGERVHMTEYQRRTNDCILEAERKAEQAPYLMQQRLIKGGVGLVNFSMCRGTTASATQNAGPDLVAYFEGESSDSEGGREILDLYFEESSDTELRTAESAHSLTRRDENGCRIQKHLSSASARQAASVNHVAASVRWVPVRHQ